MNNNTSDIELSVVIPIYNESENIKPMLGELVSVLIKIDREYEIIVIDDGSTDGSYNELLRAKENFDKIRAIKFSENSGKSAALIAGFKISRGNWIIIMDGDLQNDPHDIVKLLRYTEEGNIVIGTRFNRRASWWKRTQSKIANRIRRFILKDNFIDINCGLKVFKSSLLKNIYKFHGMHRFLPIIISDGEEVVKQVGVNDRPRFKGKSKYSMTNRLGKTIGDMLIIKLMQTRKIRYRIEESK